jgi:hypothetical protein
MAPPLSMSEAGADFLIKFLQVPEYLDKILTDVKSGVETGGPVE